MSVVTTIGDVVSIERGTTYKSALLGLPGPVLLGLGSIQRNGGFRGDSLRTYGGDTPEKLLVHPGDLYASLKDVTQSADLLGSVARLPDDGPVGRLTQDTVRLDIKGGFDGEYLFWVLRTPQYREYCRAHATGTTNLGLPRDDFFRFQFPVPDPHRLSLVSLLGSLEDKVESNRRQIATANALADELWGRVADASSARCSINALASDGTLLLSDGYRTRVDQLGERGVPILRVADVTDDHFSIRPNADHILDTFRPKYLEKMSLAGDVVVTTKGTVGRTALVGPDDVTAVYSPQICFIRPLNRDRMSSAALYRWIRSDDFRSQALQVQHQTDMAAYVSLADFRRFKLPLSDPDAEDLAQVESLDRLIAARRQEAVTLEATRDALLPELFSGRIRVPAAVEPVPDMITSPTRRI